MNTFTEPTDYFRFRQIKAAKVSEVSEATAASNVPPEERVNFHIGNPVQDPSLSSAYLRLITGLPIEDSGLHEADLQKVMEAANWPAADIQKLQLLVTLIKKSAPYMPRGGYNRKDPHYVARAFYEWLKGGQHEPLSYDMGETSGQREIMLSSGGIYESLRVLFHSIAYYSIHLPVTIMHYGCTVPAHLQDFTNLTHIHVPEDGPALLQFLRNWFARPEARPAWLLCGAIPNEITRRGLRELSLHYPLYFVEMNDAPNHQSLAREAKMMRRVLRILSPGIFRSRLKGLSLSLIAGDSELIKVMETVQFQLKGTPSASEAELLSFYLQHCLAALADEKRDDRKVIVKPKYEPAPFMENGGQLIQNAAKKYAEKASTIIERHEKLLARITGKVEAGVQNALPHAMKRVSGIASEFFSGQTAHELVSHLLESPDDDVWQKHLPDEFLSAFVRHHPEYKLADCQVISGSSRTGLGLLGFHCGIREVVIPDLSWTYEHCFPSVTVVPLTESLEIDVPGIIAAVKTKIALDSAWPAYGAVVINNPHNATGKEFNSDELQQLIQWLLHKGVYVIDDLSYQNVSPDLKLREIKTLRQLTEELERNGYVTGVQAEKVITVHSLSKTDSLAGARLSVIELREGAMQNRLREINAYITPNIAAVLLTYLFYRNNRESVDAYWRLRNRIFYYRMQAIEEAVSVLPKERNSYDITIVPPRGSMYPQMIIRKLPVGLSLDWLASGLARQGIGLVPLSTFARTEKGFSTARTTFRLTLGGTDNAETLLLKTRRVLIDMNRLIAEEAGNYKRREYAAISAPRYNTAKFDAAREAWNKVMVKLQKYCSGLVIKQMPAELQSSNYRESFIGNYTPRRVKEFTLRFTDRLGMALQTLAAIRADKGSELARVLEGEFYRVPLQSKEEMFSSRLYDRTVHPTQMYSIQTEALFDKLIAHCVRATTVPDELIRETAESLLHEFRGANIAIVSRGEATELLLDLRAFIDAEQYNALHSGNNVQSFLSFWSDWDGSSRPSGQGHSLLAAVLIENVTRQARLMNTLRNSAAGLSIAPDLINELESLPERNKKFGSLLQQITTLTHQLEKRYRGVLPFDIHPGRLRQLGMKLHIAPDPLKRLWQHNDRLERKMYELREKRRQTLEYYFSLNKRLRKCLHGLIPVIQKSLGKDAVCLEAGLYRDLMKRFVITPRIHQKMITAQDQFAIDTTVNNIYEINEIAGHYGNPGMVLALQISMATKPEALISLDRKMRTRREQALREHPGIELPYVSLIPLFEERESVENIRNYLNRIWEYALQSRRLNQETTGRFSEIMCEVFVAGSDLSQQVGQSAGMQLYKEARFTVAAWLAEKGLAEHVRMKMGSGEPMQRQGGYYSPVSGLPAFIHSAENAARFAGYLKASTRKSTEYAVTPMLGVHAGGDLRTFQSAISERLRFLSLAELSQLFHHVRASQQFHRREIIRASEPLVETRLNFKTRGMKELERLTIGRRDDIYDEFLALVTANFRQILYGREEDVAGIHIISYFVARTTPPLRDRPTVRPGQGVSGNAGRKILEKIAETIPLSRYGSMLRAIAHNQAQTAVLGINQLTTGLFRALDAFAQQAHIQSEARAIIEDRILPNLPVYEILQTIRVYHDVGLPYINRMERAFPAGNSAFLALREDVDSMYKYVGAFQRELLRRHGITVTDFFDGDKFIADLLPTLRPDLAVLLQPDLFNTDAGVLFASIAGKPDEAWRRAVRELLSIPERIRASRQEAWVLLDEPVFQRVAGFVELGVALHSLAGSDQQAESVLPAQKIKMPARISNFFKSGADDNMRQFLAAATGYLSALSLESIEVPTNIIRAMKEVERIIKIEEQALQPRQQELLRFHLLQIARLTGENG